MKRRCLVFVVTCLVGAFVAWCGGFNFDHRSVDVGFGVVMVLICAVMFAGISSVD